MLSCVEWIPAGEAGCLGEAAVQHSSCSQPKPRAGVTHPVPLQKGGGGGEQHNIHGLEGLGGLPLPQTGGSSRGPLVLCLCLLLLFIAALDRGQLEAWKALMSFQMSIFC